MTSFTRSLPVGTVRLVEAFLEGRGPVDAVHRSLLVEYVDRVFAEAIPEILELTSGKIDVLIGTGGNIETLADLLPRFRRTVVVPPGQDLDISLIDDEALPRVKDAIE